MMDYLVTGNIAASSAVFTDPSRRVMSSTCVALESSTSSETILFAPFKDSSLGSFDMKDMENRLKNVKDAPTTI